MNTQVYTVVVKLPGAGLVVLSQMAVLRRGVGVEPEVSKAAIRLRVGALETKVTAPTQHSFLSMSEDKRGQEREGLQLTS